MQDVEREGRKVTSQRDPPGQRSVYVPPGNTTRTLSTLLPSWTMCFLALSLLGGFKRAANLIRGRTMNIWNNINS